jgi:hypothetical protein
MQTITLIAVQEILGDKDTVFMKQGHGAKLHISAGACRANNLLCGVTYSRGGSRASFIRPWTVDKVEVQDLCKKCLDALHLAVTPIV